LKEGVILGQFKKSVKKS